MMSARLTHRPSIGRPLPGVRVFILDRDLRFQPVGALGEIAIAGIGLADGYLDDEPATSAGYLNRDVDGVPTRMYRTGDIGRVLHDGSVEFFGREDGQVKVNGVRVEPAEITEALRTHPDVAAAATVIVPGQRDGDGPRLVAFFRARDPLSPESARRHLRDRLPDALIPSSIVSVETWPTTPSGKVDRAELLRRLDAEPARPASAPPGDERTLQVIVTWADVTGVWAGPADRFFAVGGNSIQAIDVLLTIQTLTGHLPAMSDLLRSPSAQAFAEVIGDTLDTAGPPPIVPLRLGLDGPAVTIVAERTMSALSTTARLARALPDGLNLSLIPVDRAEPGRAVVDLVQSLGESAAPVIVGLDAIGSSVVGAALTDLPGEPRLVLTEPPRGVMAARYLAIDEPADGDRAAEAILQVIGDEPTVPERNG